MFIFRKNKKDEILNENISILQELQRNLRKLREIYGKVRNYKIANSLKNICITSDKIFKEISLNQRKLGEVATFINYYIPTLVKILKQYINIKENKLTDALNEKTLINIEKVIEDIEIAFNKILNELHKKDNYDIYSEIKVLLSELKNTGDKI